MKKMPAHKSNFCFPKGFSSSGTHAGIKKQHKDVALFFARKPCTCAAVFTSNRVTGWHVPFCKKQLAKSRGMAQAIVVTSGNANTCNGEKGRKAEEALAEKTARFLGITPNLVLAAHTGKIGVPFPTQKVLKVLPKAVQKLGKDSFGAVEAIMTTDQWPKARATEFSVLGKRVRIGGTTKGAGMICPNMATMLAFLSTDADMNRQDLQKALKLAVNKSFNCICIDNDESTNDTVLMLASGESNARIRADTNEYAKFVSALTMVCSELAKGIVQNGEGVTKFIEINVLGAASFTDAKNVASTIGQSCLVKTAIFGCDPNWGRIIAAAGRAKTQKRYDFGKVTLDLNGKRVYEKGGWTGAKPNLSGAEVSLKLDLKQGKAWAVVWASDLSYGYVEENSAYST